MVQRPFAYHGLKPGFHDTAMTHPKQEPVAIEGAAREGRWVVSCEHATARVPAEIAGGDLGLCAQDMTRHIAYDPGAWGVARALAQALDAPAIGADFSRLVIDPNRGEDDPTLIMQLYDGTIIPANRKLTEDDRVHRLDATYRPFHAALAQALAARRAPLLVSIHSFTPQLRGQPERPWHVGVLSASDRRLAAPLLARLRAEPGLCVGDNQPYNGALKGDSMDRHGLQPGRPHVLIELRNDLIADDQAQVAWGARLAHHLDAAARDASL